MKNYLLITKPKVSLSYIHDMEIDLIGSVPNFVFSQSYITGRFYCQTELSNEDAIMIKLKYSDVLTIIDYPKDVVHSYDIKKYK